MAINFKKGPGLTLQQPDKVAGYDSNEGVVQGMIVRIDNTTGNVLKGTVGSPADELLGFAINDGTQADVLASNKIGVFLLDGQSTIETDQVTGTISSFAVGQALTIDGTTGKVKDGNPVSDYIIGKVEGHRTIQGTELLGIKLRA